MKDYKLRDLYASHTLGWSWYCLCVKLSFRGGFSRCSTVPYPVHMLQETKFTSQTHFARDGPRFGETEADFCLRFGLRGNRNFGSETEEEALRRSKIFFLGNTTHSRE
jgi:hypothetical protein